MMFHSDVYSRGMASKSASTSSCFSRDQRLVSPHAPHVRPFHFRGPSPSFASAWDKYYQGEEDEEQIIANFQAAELKRRQSSNAKPAVPRTRLPPGRQDSKDSMGNGVQSARPKPLGSNSSKGSKGSMDSIDMDSMGTGVRSARPEWNPGGQNFPSNKRQAPIFSCEDDLASMYCQPPVDITVAEGGKRPPKGREGPVRSFNNLVKDPFNYKLVLLDNLHRMKYHLPTEVQAHALSLVRAGRDILATSGTGSGKTLAYLLPVIADLMHGPCNGRDSNNFAHPSAIILVPNHELAAALSFLAPTTTANTRLSPQFWGANNNLALVHSGAHQNPPTGSLIPGARQQLCLSPFWRQHTTANNWLSHSGATTTANQLALHSGAIQQPPNSWPSHLSGANNNAHAAIISGEQQAYQNGPAWKYQKQ
eukprot:gene20877-27719_t